MIPGSPPTFTDAASQTLVLRHVQTLIARVQSFFAERQDAHFKALRAYLFDQVDARPSSALAQNLRTAAVLLDKQAVRYGQEFQTALRESIEDELEAVMPGALEMLRPVDTRGVSSGVRSMALLDVDEIERHLLVDRVAQRFNAAYDGSIKPLTQCVGVLLRQDNFSQSDNPFRPATLLRAYSLAWHASDFDPAAVEDFLSVLDPRCCTDWSPLYAGLTETLVRAGFSAKPVHRIKRASGGDAAAAPGQERRDAAGAAKSGFGASEHSSHGSGFAASQALGARAGPPSEAPAAASSTIADRARQFLQKLGFGRPPGAPDVGGGSSDGAGAGGGASDDASDSRALTQPPVDAALMGFLGGLQSGAGMTSLPPWVEGQDFSGQNLLRQMREREEVQRAPELDRGTIDALAEVFDFVFADPAIPVQLKYIIGRLQIPVLKAAMINRQFFLSGEHPARKLVDALAAAAVGWIPEKGESDPLYVQIGATVKRVLAEFKNDLGLFDTLLAEFDTFLQLIERAAQAHIDPVAAQQRSTEALEVALVHADDVVHQCISALPADEPLLPFLLPFLTTQWREVMARVWIKRAADPAGWEQALQTMDQVIWSTQPKLHREDRTRLMALLPELVPRVNTSLDAIGWQGQERAEFTRSLIDTHMKVIRPPKTGHAPLDSGPAPLETPASRMALKALEARRAHQVPDAYDDFDTVTQGFTRGLWFDFADALGAWRRYRLSWVSPQRTRLLFTNRDGFDAFVRSEREVALLLRDGRLRVLDQQPIVARALEQIMGTGADAKEVDFELVW